MQRFALLFCLPAFALAQSFTATVTGVVTDRSGAAVPQAQVAITNLETQVGASTTSDNEGRYVVPALPPGRYSVKVEAPGFKQFVRTGILLEIDQRLRLDAELEVGAVTETVEVTGQAPLVDSEGSSLGAVISNRHLLNMPLNMRNTVQLAGLVPGVVLGRAFGDSFNNVGNVLINGGRGNTSEILTDGISNVTPAANPINVVSVFPPVDAIQEFKVHTNNLSAEFGRTGGGVLNFVFKSGTNRLHGSAFEFLRNSALDANEFFSNQQGIPLASFRRNQFGGTIGGPVVIPGLINGRDKLFFFASYEALRESRRSTETFTFPTETERTGDFSRTMRAAGAQCQPVNVFDPFSTRAAPGGAFVRAQFPGNVIPRSLLDPVALRAASYFPLPNGPGAACSGANNFTASNPATSTTDQVDTRIDVNPAPNDKIFLRVSLRRADRVGADHYNTIGGPNLDRLGASGPGRNASLSYTRILGPTLIAEARFGMARIREYQIPAAGPDFDMRSTLGFEGSFIEQMNRPLSFPRFAVTGYGNLGTGNQAFTDQYGSSYQAAGSVTKIAGAHTVKAGIDFRVLQAVGPNGFNTSGVYNFAPGFTQGPDPNRAGPTSGNSMASFLVGLGTGSVQIVPRLLTSNRYAGLFVQDDIRLTRKLVLNLGLRYDLETGRRDRYDHLSWFDFTVPSPLAERVPGRPDLRGGLKFVNVDGNPRNQYDLDRNNFGPRFGFAYSVNPATVVRGGYGIYYEPYSGRATSSGAGYTGFASITTWVSSLDGITPENRLSRPFPTGLNLPPGSSLGLLTAVGETLGATARDGAFDRTARVGYVQQWNFTVQRQLPGSLAVELAYAGSKGTKLTDGGGFRENQLPASALALGNALQARVANPFFGVIGTGALAGAQTTRGQLLRRYPQFLDVVNFRPNAASSSYHSFQAQVEKRFSHGVQFLLAYTAAKSIDDSSNLVDFLGGAGQHQDFYNRRGDRSLSLHDIAQRLMISYIVDLPFGRGRRFGAGWGGLADGVLGGWQLNGITTMQSGLPFLLVNRSNNSNSFSATQRPNALRNPELGGDRPTPERLARWFDPEAFAQPAPFTFGDAPRVLPNVRGDGTNNFDLSLFKNFALSADGNARIQFRAEFFNAFNTPVFAVPVGTYGAANFAAVSSQENNPRQVQFGLKILF